MSPMLENMLIHEVVPRIRNAVRTIPKIGCEDCDEIVQDTTMMAVRMMVAAEDAGRSFTASNIAHYATQAARSGRRSYYAGRTDAMSPGCQIAGRARFKSLDEDVEFDTGEHGTLHDLIAPFHKDAHESDPAEEAARNLDWDKFLSSHSPRHRAAVIVLAEGGTMRDAGKSCGISDASASNLKRRIAYDLIAFFGEDVIRRLLDGVRHGWESDLRMTR